MIYVLNSHKTFTVAWGTIKGWLDPMIVNKVQLYNTNTCAELMNTVEPEHLLQEYGGKSTWPGYFWPPYVPALTSPVDQSNHYESHEELSAANT